MTKENGKTIVGLVTLDDGHMICVNGKPEVYINEVDHSLAEKHVSQKLKSLSKEGRVERVDVRAPNGVLIKPVLDLIRDKDESALQEAELEWQKVLFMDGRLLPREERVIERIESADLIIANGTFVMNFLNQSDFENFYSTWDLDSTVIQLETCEENGQYFSEEFTARDIVEQSHEFSKFTFANMSEITFSLNFPEIEVKLASPSM